MRTVAIINQKGGCGKTTTAINLAAVFAREGRRTLLVDMDPQSHAAAGLGIPESRIELDIGDAMLQAGVKPIETPRLLWRAARNLDLAPSRTKLAGLEAPQGGLADLPDREHRLALVLRQYKHDYDLSLIDCPPSIGLLTYNALAAADLVLIPVETSYFALQGAAKQITTVRALARRLGVQLPVWIVPTIHDDASAVASDLLRELHRRFDGRVAPLVIRRDTSLREAASYGQPVIDFAPDSPGAADYARLGTWLGEVLTGKIEPGHHHDTHDDHGAHDLHHPDAIAEPPVPEVRVPNLSPQVLADRSAETTPADPATIAASVTEPKLQPANRAEDVARRAQEFLRRMALGRAADTGGTPSTTPLAPLPSLQPIATAEAPPTPATLPTLRLDVKTVPVAPSTGRLLGVRETNQGVLFVQPLATGLQVAIAGSFNNWSPTAHVLRRNPQLGVHELCLKLPPGRVEYRLVIDGQWSADPHNNDCQPNPFGEINSVFVVGAERALTQTA